MKVYPPCTGCGAALVSSHTQGKAPTGMRRHAGHGYCCSCLRALLARGVEPPERPPPSKAGNPVYAACPRCGYWRTVHPTNPAGFCRDCLRAPKPRATATDYTQALCVGNEPEMWTDYGTPEAHRLCAACPIRAGCLRDAKAEGASGVMRANQVFPDRVNRSRNEMRLARRLARDAARGGVDDGWTPADNNGTIGRSKAGRRANEHPASEPPKKEATLA